MKLFHKLLLALVPALLVGQLAVILYSKRSIRAVMDSTDASVARARTEDFLEKLGGRLSGGERRLLPVLQAVRRESGASYAFLLDPSGRVLAHTDLLQTGRLFDDPVSRASLKADGFLLQGTTHKGQPVLDAAHPVWSVVKSTPEEFLLSGKLERRRIGTVRLGLPRDRSLLIAHRIDKRIVLIVTAASVLVLLVLFLVLKRMLSPLNPLLLAIGRVGRGEYGVAVPVDSTDEFGELARDFNRMSQALAETTVSKDFLDDILAGMQGELFVTDTEGKITLVNPAVVELLGRPEEELLGRPAAALFEPDPALARFTLAAIEEHGPLRGVGLHFVCKGGRRVPVLFSGSILRVKGGRAVGLIGTAKDISALKEMERRLVQSEKLSAVGQLAAGVAHEINNPLGVILGFAQAAVRRLPAGDALELPLRSIEREALRCKRLVQDLLTFSRQGQTGLNERFDLAEAVAGALPLVETQARIKSVTVERDLVPGAWMRGDKSQVQQVVINLCSNAFDAMPGGGSLRVRVRPAYGGAPVLLEVADTGTGITDAVREHLFEPFFTTKPVGQGTGLGLALIREIVQKHGGEIEVRNSPEKGAVFSISFPTEGSDAKS